MAEKPVAPRRSEKSAGSRVSRKGCSIADTLPLAIGDPVLAGAKKDLQGIVRFVGETSFAAGEWVGVELDADVGKNDGSVNGTRYFQCEAKRGIFCKPEIVRRIPEAERHSPPRRSEPHVSPKGRSKVPKDAGQAGGIAPRVGAPAPAISQAAPADAKPAPLDSPAPPAAPEVGQDRAEVGDEAVSLEAMRQRYEASKKQYEQLMKCCRTTVSLRDSVQDILDHAHSVNDALGSCENRLSGASSSRPSCSGLEAVAVPSDPASARRQELLRDRAMEIARRLQDKVCGSLEEQVANVVTKAVETGTEELVEAARATQRLVAIRRRQ